MLQQEKPDDFVIATGKTYSVRDFLNYVFEYANLDVDKYVEIDQRLYRPHEVPLLLGDASKARAILGWEPKYTMQTLAKEMYKDDWHAQEKILRSNFGVADPLAFPSK